MVSGRRGTLPILELDLTAKSVYRRRDYNVNVYRLGTFSKYDVYTHMLKEHAPFSMRAVKVDGGHILVINKDNVSMVTVYFDRSNRILLFETYYEDKSVRNDGIPIHRYHARDIKRASDGSSGIGESSDYCWIEYMYGYNETLHEGNVDDVLEKYETKKLPLNMIKASDNYFRVVRTHEHRDKICGYCKPVENQVTQEELEYDDYDLEAQTDENGGFFDFMTSSKGMVTAVATGSVGGAAIGGTLIYMVAS
nr:hypothetical protein MACL_00001702 [Theileria orientalis]